MAALGVLDKNVAQPETRELAGVRRISREAALVLAGVLLLAAGVGILLGIITAEALYPDIYTTHDNEISDLGATRPPDSIIRQPSARVFNATMLGTGTLILAGTYFLHRGFGSPRTTISVGLLGLGVLGVGVFPGNYGAAHPIFAMMAFVSGGIAAVLTAKVQTGPFRYVSMALGVVALGALTVGMLADATPLWDELGDGGVERWIAYPVVLWIVAFGAYLMGRADGAVT